MKLRYILFFFLSGLIFSCKNPDIIQQNISEKHGDTLHLNLAGINRNYNPHSITNQDDKIVAWQIYEGLLKYNPRNLVLTPALAKYWIFGEESKKYTFFLRTNAYFHKNDCFNTAEKTKKITASDIKYSFEKLCTFSEEQKHIPLNMIEIVGAEEYFNATKYIAPKQGITGIEVLNDSTLNISIKAPNSLFIYSLAEINMVVIPHEAIEMYGNESFVGSGPFCLDNHQQNTDNLLLYRNDLYYFKDNEGFPLPYFNNIEIAFEENIDKEISLFENEIIDVVFNLPTKTITPFLEKHVNEFKGENLKYVMEKDESSGLTPSYIVYTSKLKNMTSNRKNYIDFTRVYFEE